MEYNYNDRTTKDLEEELNKIGDQYKTLSKELEKRKQEAEELKRTKLAQEKELREKEINDARNHYYELLQSFINDFGSYQHTSKSDDFPSNFWDWFFKL